MWRDGIQHIAFSAANIMLLLYILPVILTVPGIALRRPEREILRGKAQSTQHTQHCLRAYGCFIFIWKCCISFSPMSPNPPHNLMYARDIYIYVYIFSVGRLFVRSFAIAIALAIAIAGVCYCCWKTLAGCICLYSHGIAISMRCNIRRIL